MTLEEDGHRIVEACKAHLLSVMGTLPDCQPHAVGVGSTTIERSAGFELELQGQDNWFTWSLLRSMVSEGAIEMLTARRARYRLNG